MLVMQFRGTEDRGEGLFGTTHLPPCHILALSGGFPGELTDLLDKLIINNHSYSHLGLVFALPQGGDLLHLSLLVVSEDSGLRIGDGDELLPPDLEASLGRPRTKSIFHKSFTHASRCPFTQAGINARLRAS